MSDSGAAPRGLVEGGCDHRNPDRTVQDDQSTSRDSPMDPSTDPARKKTKVIKKKDSDYVDLERMAESLPAHLSLQDNGRATNRCYLPKMVKFLRWVKEHGYSDPCSNSTHKIHTVPDVLNDQLWVDSMAEFLEHTFLLDGGQSAGDSESNVDLHIQAIIRLWHVCYWNKGADFVRNHPQATAPTLKNDVHFRWLAIVKGKITLRRESRTSGLYDIQKHAPKKSYEEQILKVLDEYRSRSLDREKQKRSKDNLPYTWHKDFRAAQGLREAAMFAVGDSSLDRSDTQRALNFCHVGSEVNYAYRDGYTCSCSGEHTCDRQKMLSLRFFLPHRKGWHFDPGASEPLLTSTITRHKDPLICPVGAVADYLVYRFHFEERHPHGPLENEPMPDFNNPADWYKRPLFKGKDHGHDPSIEDPENHAYRTYAGMCGTEQSNLTKRVFGITKIDSNALNHETRKVASNRLRKMSGGNNTMVSGKGHWAEGSGRSGGSTVMLRNYLTSVDIAAEAHMAGFANPNHYHLSRDAIPVPQACLDKVFPGIEQAVKEAEEKMSTANADHCALGFSTALKRLRVVFIQDRIFKHRRSPDVPLWRDLEVFQMPEYIEYVQRLDAHLESSAVANAIPATVKEMMPDVAHMFRAVCDRVSGLQQATVPHLTSIHGMLATLHQQPSREHEELLHALQAVTTRVGGMQDLMRQVFTNVGQICQTAGADVPVGNRESPPLAVDGDLPRLPPSQDGPVAELPSANDSMSLPRISTSDGGSDGWFSAEVQTASDLYTEWFSGWDGKAPISKMMVDGKKVFPNFWATKKTDAGRKYFMYRQAMISLIDERSQQRRNASSSGTAFSTIQRDVAKEIDTEMRDGDGNRRMSIQSYMQAHRKKQKQLSSQ